MDGKGTFCTKCGDRLPDGADFCPKCGTAVFKEALAQSEQAPASATPKSPDRSLQVDIWLAVLIHWIALHLFVMGSGDSMLLSGDTPTILGALVGMMSFLLIWFYAGKRLDILSVLSKPSAERGKPHWSVYITISVIWLFSTVMIDGVVGLVIGLLYLLYAAVVALLSYSLSRLPKQSLQRRVTALGQIGLVGWIIPPIGFGLAIACLYASIETTDAKKIRFGVVLSAAIIILSMLSSGIGAHNGIALSDEINLGALKARALGDEFRHEALGSNITLDRAISAVELRELIPICGNSAKLSADSYGARIDWNVALGGTSVRYCLIKSSPPGELVLCNENTGWESMVTRIRYTELSVSAVSNESAIAGVSPYYTFPSFDSPTTAKGLKLGDRIGRAIWIYGKPLKSEVQEEPLLPIEYFQFEDDWGAILGVAVDRATERIVEISVKDAEPIAN